MPTRNDLEYLRFSTNSGTSGSLPDVTRNYLQQVTGSSSDDVEDLWRTQMVLLGYAVVDGDWTTPRFEYLGDLGYIGTHNDRYFAWLLDGGAFGPNVQIVPQGEVPTVGFCDYAPAGNCTASRQYVANTSGFDSPVTSYVWSIESGTATITAGQGTATVTVETQNLDADSTFVLKVVASNVDPESAERESTQTHYHREDLAVVSIASEGLPTGSCEYNSTTGGTTCTAIDTYKAAVTGTPTSYTWVLSDVTGAGGAATITGGQGTDTVEVTTTGPTDVGFKLTLDLTSQFQTANGSDTFSQTHTDTGTAPVFLGPDFANANLLQGETYAPSPVAPDRFSDNVLLWALGGTWPADLVIDPNTGAISGTVTDAVATYANLTITAQNALGTTPSNTFSIDVQASGTAPVWAGTLGPFQWVKDEAITPVQLYADFGSPTLPVTYAIASGALPVGISLDVNTGVISGTPTTNATGSFSVSATNASGTDTTNVGSWEVADSFGPAFHALTPDPDTYEMLGVRTGTGGLTSTHTADVYAADFEGVYRGAGEDQPVWTGGRVVRNYINSSNDLENGWSVLSATLTPGVLDPDGGNTAYTLTATGSFGRISAIIRPAGFTGPTILNSWWVRRRTGTGVVNIRNCDGTDTTITPNGTWQRFAGAPAVTDGSNDANQITCNTAGDEIDIWHPQSEGVEGQTITTIPSEYVPNLSTSAFPTLAEYGYAVFGNVNGNTLGAGQVVTEAVGTPLAEVPYLQYYPAAQNDCTYSNDFTNAAWVKSNMTAAFDQVGLTGAPNTASLLTATAGNATAIQTVTAASGTHSSKFYIKRSVGTGTVEITVDNVVWTPVVLTSDFQSFEVDATVTNPQIGVRIVTSGDAVIVGNGEGYLTKTTEQVRGLGPLFRESSPMATDATLYEFDYANQDDLEAAWYLEYSPSVGSDEGAQNNYVDLSVSGAARPLYYDGATPGIVRCRGLSGDSNFNNGLIPASPHKGGTVYSATDNQMTVAYDGNYGNDPGWTGFTSPTNLRIMADVPGFSDATRMRELQRYDITSYAEGKTIIDGLMT